jgi:hypothetical protein
MLYIQYFFVCLVFIPYYLHMNAPSQIHAKQYGTKLYEQKTSLFSRLLPLKLMSSFTFQS